MSVTPLYNRLLTRQTAPANEPLTLNDVKSYLRVGHADEDTLIGDLITTARMTAENWMRRSLITQTWRLGYDDSIPLRVGLPMGPVQSIDSISIIDRDNSSQTVSSALYHLNSGKTHACFDSTLSGFYIEISYIAGYGDNASDVPAPIRQGMLSHIAALYEGRGDDSQPAIPEQAFSLYAPFREVLL